MCGILAGLAENIDSELIPISSTAKVLIVGMGADEQLAGYGRHRTAYNRDGLNGLAEELTVDKSRLWKRNLVRIFIRLVTTSVFHSFCIHFY